MSKCVFERGGREREREREHVRGRMSVCVRECVREYVQGCACPSVCEGAPEDPSQLET